MNFYDMYPLLWYISSTDSSFMLSLRFPTMWLRAKFYTSFRCSIFTVFNQQGESLVTFEAMGKGGEKET